MLHRPHRHVRARLLRAGRLPQRVQPRARTGRSRRSRWPRRCTSSSAASSGSGWRGSSPAATCASSSSPAASSAASALAVLGQVEERWQLYVVYAVFAVGFAPPASCPVTTVVTRWYHVRRSVALSVASTGLSAGGIVFTPFAKWLIDDRGLESATPILARDLAGRRRSRSPSGSCGPIRPRSAGCPTAIGSAPTRPRWSRPGTPFHEAVRTPLLPRRHVRLRPRARRPGRRHPAARQARRGAHRPEHGGAGDDRPGRHVGGRPAGRRARRVAACRWRASRSSSPSLQAVVAGRPSPSPRARWRSSPRSSCSGRRSGNLLMLQPLLIAERFGVLDYAADLQPLAVPHDVRGGRRTAAARLAVRQRRRLPDVVPRRRVLLAGRRRRALAWGGPVTARTPALA